VPDDRPSSVPDDRPSSVAETNRECEADQQGTMERGRNFHALSWLSVGVAADLR
ncbi:hypothetical protein Ancab_003885, partial [Ancistrocladus abbreviatus]